MTFHCPNCKSKKIMSVRLDGDIGYGGEVNMMNESFEYTDRQKIMAEENDRPDIDCLICLECNWHFEKELVSDASSAALLPNAIDQGAGEPTPLKTEPA